MVQIVSEGNGGHKTTDRGKRKIPLCDNELVGTKIQSNSLYTLSRSSVFGCHNEAVPYGFKSTRATTEENNRFFFVPLSTTISYCMLFWGETRCQWRVVSSWRFWRGSYVCGDAARVSLCHANLYYLSSKILLCRSVFLSMNFHKLGCIKSWYWSWSAARNC